MDVSVTGSTAEGLGLAGVLEIDKDQTGAAVAGAGGGADGNGVLPLLVDDHVVGAADWEVVPPTGDVLGGIKGDGLLGVDLEELHTQKKSTSAVQSDEERGWFVPCSCQRPEHRG